jgi:membrane fusion protein (multidrug efflux system)
MSHRRSFVMGIMLGAIVTGCGDGSRAGAPPPPPVVKVEAVVQRDVPISAEWVGALVGYITAQIRPRVGGHLMSQNYTEGAVVKAGDLMFQVDPRPYQTALEQVEARLLQAESQLSQARRRSARVRPSSSRRSRRWPRTRRNGRNPRPISVGPSWT